MIVALASDHAGFTLKQELVAFVRGLGHTAVDLGTDSTVSCDYPDFAEKIAAEILGGRAQALAQVLLRTRFQASVQETARIIIPPTKEWSMTR